MIQIDLDTVLDTEDFRIYGWCRLIQQRHVNLRVLHVFKLGWLYHWSKVEGDFLLILGVLVGKEVLILFYFGCEYTLVL